MKSLYALLMFLQNCHTIESLKTSNVIQDTGLKRVKVGQSVILNCSSQEDQSMYVSWYQQRLGAKPELILYWLKVNTDQTIMEGYKQRFKGVQNEETSSLLITDLQPSDSATYYCGVQIFGPIEFGKGVFVHVQPSTSYALSVVQQQTKKQLWQGDSLDLSCVVEAESCPGNRSLFWFRRGTSQEAIIYPDDDDCQALSTITCTVKLKVEAVQTTDAGIYHCALVSCGEIIFGNGTTVEISDLNVSRLLFWLSVALGLFVITTCILAIIVHKLKRKVSASHHGAVPHHADLDMNQQDIHYAALNVNMKPQQQTQDNTENTCTYSSVRRP